MKRFFLILLVLQLACVSTVHKQAVVRQKIEFIQTMKVCNSYGLYVRSDAGIENPVVDVLQDGDIVTLTGREKRPVMIAWYEISKPHGGWISSRYTCPIQ